MPVSSRTTGNDEQNNQERPPVPVELGYSRCSWLGMMDSSPLSEPPVPVELDYCSRGGLGSYSVQCTRPVCPWKERITTVSKVCSCSAWKTRNSLSPFSFFNPQYEWTRTQKLSKLFNATTAKVLNNRWADVIHVYDWVDCYRGRLRPQMPQHSQSLLAKYSYHNLQFQAKLDKSFRCRWNPTPKKLSFPRETRLYTDAKLLKTRLIGTAPINKKNVHCDWLTTR